MKQLICYFDGACEPRNPGGNMGIGACIFAPFQLQHVIKKEDAIFTYSDFIPEAKANSNNVAEYLGFRALLQWISKNYSSRLYSPTVQIWGDSKMVIMQMRGIWKIKAGYYVPIATECQGLLKELQRMGLTFSINWHKRELNGYADKLSKAGMIANNVEFKIQPQG